MSIDSSENIQKVESKQLSSDAAREVTGQSKKVQQQPAKKPTQEQHGSSIDDQIVYLRQEYTKDIGSIYKTLHLAEALLNRDLNVHDGGSIQSESIRTFLSAPLPQLAQVARQQGMYLANVFNKKQKEDEAIFKYFSLGSRRNVNAKATREHAMESF